MRYQRGCAVASSTWLVREQSRLSPQSGWMGYMLFNAIDDVNASTEFSILEIFEIECGEGIFLHFRDVNNVQQCFNLRIHLSCLKIDFGAGRDFSHTNHFDDIVDALSCHLHAWYQDVVV